jgi:hypothetical protein
MLRTTGKRVRVSARVGAAGLFAGRGELGPRVAPYGVERVLLSHQRELRRHPLDFVLVVWGEIIVVLAFGVGLIFVGVLLAYWSAWAVPKGYRK